MRTPTQSAKQRSAANSLTDIGTYIHMYIYLATATTTTTTMSVITATHSRMRHLQQYVRKTTTNAPTSGRDASELHHIFANTARRVLVSNSICLHTTHNFSIYRISMYVCVYVCMYVCSISSMPYVHTWLVAILWHTFRQLC